MPCYCKLLLKNDLQCLLVNGAFFHISGMLLYLSGMLLYQPFHFVYVLLYQFLRNFVVLKVACKIVVVSRHVDEAMPGKVEEDDFRLAGLRAFLRLPYRRRNGVA